MIFKYDSGSWCDELASFFLSWFLLLLGQEKPFSCAVVIVASFWNYSVSRRSSSVANKLGLLWKFNKFLITSISTGQMSVFLEGSISSSLRQKTLKFCRVIPSSCMIIMAFIYISWILYSTIQVFKLNLLPCVHPSAPSYKSQEIFLRVPALPSSIYYMSCRYCDERRRNRMDAVQ